MGFIKKNICPNCSAEYSALRPSCPACGTRKPQPSSRTPAATDSVRQGTEANARAEENTRWQLIFGLCLVAAVIIAVIVLITTTLNGSYDTYATPTPPEEVDTLPSPSVPPTPTPTPTPTVEELKMTFLGTATEGFAMDIGETIQLKESIYPLEILGPVEWSSENEAICTVDETGLVTGVSSGTTKVILRCFGASAECTVLVR